MYEGIFTQQQGGEKHEKSTLICRTNFSPKKTKSEKKEIRKKVFSSVRFHILPEHA